MTRKDNELLIWANKKLPKPRTQNPPSTTNDRRKSQETPLRGRYRDYLTEIDVTYPCERLPDDYQAHLDKPLSKAERLKKLEAERDWFLDLDQDMESDNPPF